MGYHYIAFLHNIFSKSKYMYLCSIRNFQYELIQTKLSVKPQKGYTHPVLFIISLEKVLIWIILLNV